MTPSAQPAHRAAAPAHSARLRAVIDLGSNTAKLAVARIHSDGRIEWLAHDSQACRLGQGVHATGRLQPEAVERTLAVIARFAERARSLGAARVDLYATSAARSAADARTFLDHVEHETGVHCTVLSGDQEAAFIFAGASSTPGLGDAELLVIDLGGGSMEFITGRHGRIERRASRDVGCVRTTEAFFARLPPTPESIAALEAHLDRELAPVFADFQAGDRVVVATGGTIYTLARQLDPAFWEHVDDGPAPRFTRLAIAALAEDLGRLTLDQLRARDGIPGQRADLIPAGVHTFRHVFQRVGVDTFAVATRGLRHGLLLEPLHA